MWKYGQQDMGGILAVVVDPLRRDHFGRGQANVVLAGIEVRQVERVVAARDLDPYPVALLEEITGSAPELDGVLVHLIRLDRAQLLRGEPPLTRRIAVTRPHDALAQERGASIR